MLPHSEVQKLLWRAASPESQAWWNKGTLLSFPSCTSSTTIKTIRAPELTLNHTENVEREVCVGVRVEKISSYVTLELRNVSSKLCLHGFRQLTVDALTEAL